MKEYICIYIIVGIITLIYYLIPKKSKTISIQKVEEQNKTIEYKYEPQHLMTTNEKIQFRKIQIWANKHNLLIFTKVRLLDLITPRRDQQNYKGALWKIQSKHVDFVICDQEIRVKCIIEINDRSHNQQDRIERDKFVLEVLQACGYKMLMTYNITDEQLDKICGYDQPDQSTI